MTKIKSGFTLIEVITVLFILSLGLVGVLTLIVQNIQSQSINKNNLIAYQLAQEGIELIRKTRDTNWRNIPPRPWNTGLAADTYYIDYRDTVPHELISSDETRLKQDTDGFYYHDVHSSDPDSPFTRQITLASQGGGGFYIRSQVGWQERGRSYSYILETIIYGWK